MASPVPQKDDVERWTVEQVAAWLRQMELTDCCEFFLRRGIDGHSLMELTEEGLILWGRDVSIRNRKKILKLTKLIESQYLSSSGRQQSSPLPDETRLIPETRMNPPTSSDQESDNSQYDEDSFSSDGYSEDEETVNLGNGVNSTEPVNEELYLVPSISEVSRGFPNPSKPVIPSKPLRSGKLGGTPERRPQMPLPPANVKQAPSLPPRPSQNPASPPIASKRLSPPSVNSSERPRCIPAIPNAAKPTMNVHLKHTLKKPSECPTSQHSLPEPSNEGRIHRVPPAPVEDTDNEYEVVNPPGASMENECHSAPSCGFPSSQEPPPLPKRNQDGRDGNWSGPGLQQLSATSNNTHGRPLPSPSVLTSRNVSLGNKVPVRKQPLQPKPLSLPIEPPSHPSYLKPNPQFTQPPPLEKAPRAPTASDRSNFLPSCAERVNIGDGESVELSPLYRSLIDRPYFHVISRSKSKKLLEKATDGVFLIRPSTRSSDPLTLCLQYSGRTYNINIRRRNDAHYALGTEKVNEMTFKSVDELVSTYSNEPIKLQSGERVRLKDSPAKEDHVYVRLPMPVKKKY